MSPQAQQVLAMVLVKLAEAELLAEGFVSDPFDRGRLREIADRLSACSVEVARTFIEAKPK